MRAVVPNQSQSAGQAGAFRASKLKVLSYLLNGQSVDHSLMRYKCDTNWSEGDIPK